MTIPIKILWSWNVRIHDTLTNIGREQRYKLPDFNFNQSENVVDFMLVGLEISADITYSIDSDHISCRFIFFKKIAKKGVQECHLRN